MNEKGVCFFVFFFSFFFLFFICCAMAGVDDGAWEDSGVPLDLTDHLGTDGTTRPSLLELAAEEDMNEIVVPAVKVTTRFSHLLLV
jgi:hypothetical protein